MPSFYMGIKYLPASKATVISNLHPMCVTLSAVCLLGETLRAGQALMVILAFSGVIIMNITKTFSTKLDYSDELIWYGIML